MVLVDYLQSPTLKWVMVDYLPSPTLKLVMVDCYHNPRYKDGIGRLLTITHVIKVVSLDYLS